MSLEWLAGLLEGEGCFSAYQGNTSPHSRRQLRVEINMTDEDVVRRAATLWPGASKIWCRQPPKTGRRASHAPLYRMQWSGQRAEDLMLALLPHMGRRRTAKIEECLRFELSHHPR